MGFCRPSSTYTDFGWFQSLLKNAQVFVSPKVDFVFSGPHPLGFKVTVRVENIIDRQHAGYSAVLGTEHGMDGASLCVWFGRLNYAKKLP